MVGVSGAEKTSNGRSKSSATTAANFTVGRNTRFSQMTENKIDEAPQHPQSSRVVIKRGLMKFEGVDVSEEADLGSGSTGDDKAVAVGNPVEVSGNGIAQVPSSEAKPLNRAQPQSSKSVSGITDDTVPDEEEVASITTSLEMPIGNLADENKGTNGRGGRRGAASRNMRARRSRRGAARGIESNNNSGGSEEIVPAEKVGVEDDKSGPRRASKRVPARRKHSKASDRPVREKNARRNASEVSLVNLTEREGEVQDHVNGEMNEIETDAWILSMIDNDSYKKSLEEDAEEYLQETLLPKFFWWSNPQTLIPTAAKDIDEYPPIIHADETPYNEVEKLSRTTPLPDEALFGGVTVPEVNRSLHGSSSWLYSSHDFSLGMNRDLLENISRKRKRTKDTGVSFMLVSREDDPGVLRFTVGSGKPFTTFPWKSNDPITKQHSTSLDDIAKGFKNRVRSYKISVKVAGASSRESIFSSRKKPAQYGEKVTHLIGAGRQQVAPFTFFDTPIAFDGPVKNCNIDPVALLPKENNTSSLEALLPSMVQVGRNLSINTIRMMDRDGTYPDLGSYDMRRFSTEIEDVDRSSGSRAKRISIGRIRTIWSAIPSDYNWDLYNQAAGIRIPYYSSLTGQKIDSVLYKRPRDVKVRIKLRGIYYSGNDEDFEGALAAERKPSLLHSSKKLKLDNRRPLSRFYPGECFQEGFIPSFVYNSLNGSCRINVLSYTHSFIRRFKKETKLLQNESPSSTLDKLAPKFHTVTDLDFTPPRLEAMPLQDGPFRVFCMEAGSMNSADIKDILDRLKRSGFPSCVMCLGLLVASTAVEACTSCGLYAHAECFEALGKNSTWKCTSCKGKTGCLKPPPVSKPRRQAKLPSRYVGHETHLPQSSSSNESTKTVPENCKCTLCPHSGGIMNKDDSGEYAHTLCRIWTALSTEEGSNSRDELDRTCALCGDHGACSKGLLKCAAKGCRVKFHPMCAAIVTNLQHDIPKEETGKNDRKKMDDKLCNQYTLCIANIEMGRNEAGEPCREHVPIAFCPLHNSKREESLRGLPARGGHFSQCVKIPMREVVH